MPPRRRPGSSPASSKRSSPQPQPQGQPEPEPEPAPEPEPERRPSEAEAAAQQVIDALGPKSMGEVLKVQADRARAGLPPYSDADALLSAVLQAEAEAEGGDEDGVGVGSGEAELQEALRKLAAVEADIDAARVNVRQAEAALQEAPESDSEDEEEEEDDEQDEGVAAAQGAAGAAAWRREARAAQLQARPVPEAEPQPLDASQAAAVGEAGFDVQEVGKLCSLLGMSADKTKLVQQDLAAKAKQQLEPEPEPGQARQALSAGDRVEVFGLVAAAQHNGKRGTVQRWLHKKRRYLVRLDGAESPKPIAVKPANLQLRIHEPEPEPEPELEPPTKWVLNGFAEPTGEETEKRQAEEAGQSGSRRPVRRRGT